MRQVVRVLIIEDQEREAKDAQREIMDAFEDNEEIEACVSIASDFDDGFSRVRDGKSDVVVLDVRRESATPGPEDSAAGHAAYLDIKRARFAPVVFWTALPEKVKHEEMRPLVTVLSKEDIDQLPSAITAAVESGALATINEIEEQVARSLTDHMWNELAPNWAEYRTRAEGGDAKGSDIAQVLLSRLARIIDDERKQADATHPGHRYVYPPASARRAPGDILRSEDETWWVVLTPACDLVQKKVEFVLVAQAGRLESNGKFKKWAKNRSNGAWSELERDVLRATQGRYYYLPAFREVPDLVVDLENVRSVAAGKLEEMEAIASLVSPFSEALLVQHSQFRGRVGVPDLDVSALRRRLESSVTAE